MTGEKGALQIDPLQRVFVPIEKRREDGTRVLYTTDKTKYIRGVDGVIRRADPKVNGKQARKDRRRCRIPVGRRK